MDTIRILMIVPYLPNQKNVITVLAQNILHSLQKKTNPTLIWILLTPSQKFENAYRDIQIKPIQNYYDACDIMNKEKPDVVITDLSFSYSSYPFILAAKFKKIPVITYQLYGYDLSSTVHTTFNIFLSKLRRFFSKSNIDTGNNPFSRGKFYLYKYFFYLKTIKSCNLGYSKIFSHIVESLWINSFGILDKKLDTRLITDKVCLSNNTWINPLIKSGFPKNSLVVTGSPIFDEYDISKIKQKKIEKNKIIKILLVTGGHQSHGQVSKKSYSKKIFNTILEIHKNPKYSLGLKIHPSSDKIEYYSKILNKFSSEIPIFQHENLSELLEDYDVAISLAYLTGSHLDILNSGTPLIIMALFENPELSPVLKCDCAFRCDSISYLDTVIKDSLNRSIPMKNIQSFFNLFSNPFDGKASERFADVILSTLDKT